MNAKSADYFNDKSDIKFWCENTINFSLQYQYLKKYVATLLNICIYLFSALQEVMKKKIKSKSD